MFLNVVVVFVCFYELILKKKSADDNKNMTNYSECKKLLRPIALTIESTLVTEMFKG